MTYADHTQRKKLTSKVRWKVSWTVLYAMFEFETNIYDVIQKMCMFIQSPCQRTTRALAGWFLGPIFCCKMPICIILEISALKPEFCITYFTILVIIFTIARALAPFTKRWDSPDNIQLPLQFLQILKINISIKLICSCWSQHNLIYRHQSLAKVWIEI